jgi:hypothetical protein
MQASPPGKTAAFRPAETLLQQLLLKLGRLNEALHCWLCHPVRPARFGFAQRTEIHGVQLE